ncbi:MAG: hypothetical protein ACYTKC_19705 [Planctomycetota bacterium]
MLDQDKRAAIAQWAFDTRPLLLRFHLWLEDVVVETEENDARPEDSFVPPAILKCLAMTSGLTALGTKVFGDFGMGAGADKATVNRAKKSADGMSAYIMSEALWHLTRNLPENHAIMVCLGEGLMPKAGETPEMGANPQLGFGRVYARAQVAKQIDALVNRLLNEPGFTWNDFYRTLKHHRLTVWGAAIDTLENTSRFAKGMDSGPMSVFHLFDQPLTVSRPYESYMGTLAVPQPVRDEAEKRSILIDFLTPRAQVVQAIESAYPGIRRQNIHVWTLRGPSRELRLGRLWREWTELGVHLVEDGWVTPSGGQAFTESGTYAPTFMIGSWNDHAGNEHLFLVDGYAASAEAMQAASLSEILNVDVSLALFSPTFALPHDEEYQFMRIDPADAQFRERLGRLLGEDTLSDSRIADLRTAINSAHESNIRVEKRILRADDFLPEKDWRMLATTGYMSPDPYTGAPGVTQLAEDRYQVTTRVATKAADIKITFEFRLLESLQQSRLIFSPLLVRLIAGGDYTTRPVKVSDSGRIRNEIQTIMSTALEYEGSKIRVCFDRVHEEAISSVQKIAIREVLQWYKANHPVWFDWLELG